MRTTIEENELNTELQELYLKNKQWLTDLDFLESELMLLKTSLKKNDISSNGEAYVRLSGSETVLAKLKTDLLSYLHRVENLIKNPGQIFDLSIIETYALLEIRSKEALNLFKEIKAIYLSKQKQNNLC
ncbi:hypothetical protein EIM50_15760 [Pseudoxanthomonas sp. SGD-10]|nr:hypothetical protein EIM50_15760 [Pseudoxanthomonas sp. SGD-10]